MNTEPDPTARAPDDGRPVVVVQLLRFVEGGRDRYLQYARAAQPILLRLGAQVLYAGELGAPLAGEAWNGIVVTRYPTRASYLEMLADPDYQKTLPLRRAALREAIIVPSN